MFFILFICVHTSYSIVAFQFYLIYTILFRCCGCCCCCFGCILSLVHHSVWHDRVTLLHLCVQCVSCICARKPNNAIWSLSSFVFFIFITILSFVDDISFACLGFVLLFLFFYFCFFHFEKECLCTIHVLDRPKNVTCSACRLA